MKNVPQFQTRLEYLNDQHQVVERSEPIPLKIEDVGWRGIIKLLPIKSEGRSGLKIREGTVCAVRFKFDNGRRSAILRHWRNTDPKGSWVIRKVR